MMRLQTERDARLLGYAGLIPFAFAVLVIWGTPRIVPAYFAQNYLGWTLYYAATILSFMGGARWGLALLADGKRPGEPYSGFLAAVAPALVGWVCTVPSGLLPVPFPYTVRFGILALAFGGLLYEDLRGAKAGEAPMWYASLRKSLTFWVIVSLAFIVVRLYAN